MIIGAILQTAAIDYAMMLVARVVTGQSLPTVSRIFARLCLVLSNNVAKGSEMVSSRPRYRRISLNARNPTDEGSSFSSKDRLSLS